MTVGDAHVFPGFLTPVLTKLFFPKPPSTFLTCVCRGDRRKYAGKKVCLNRGSNQTAPTTQQILKNIVKNPLPNDFLTSVKKKPFENSVEKIEKGAVTSIFSCSHDVLHSFRQIQSFDSQWYNCLKR